ncbi:MULTISPECIES: sporulation protein [unclassified Nocardia]|uniref:sporulation protein n=1 Tax=unclassified Nocardia TaxID=2637762 RepID=UPI001CE3D07A|nr:MULTISPECIES: sporulation protein [unclassified Nocardia]
MKNSEIRERARDAIAMGRVFGEPYESAGAVVIPAAIVGGGGGGAGIPDEGGEGLALAFGGRPVGAFVLRDGVVTWQPAVDVNTIVQTVGWVLSAGIVAFGLLRLPRRLRG